MVATETYILEAEKRRIPDEPVARPDNGEMVGTEASDKRPTPMAVYFLTVMPRSSVSVLAMVDESGDLVRVLTASDLLREFKAQWKAARE